MSALTFLRDFIYIYRNKDNNLNGNVYILMIGLLQNIFQ